MFPVDFVAFVTNLTFSRWGVLAAAAGAFVATLSFAVSYSFRKLEHDLTKDADDDDDADSVVSVGGKARRAFEAISARVAELRRRLEKPGPKAKPEPARRYADAGTSNVTAKAAAKLSGAPPRRDGRRGARNAKSAETIHADLYLARRRCLKALVNMSADARLDWRRRLRCHAALLNLTAKGRRAAVPRRVAGRAGFGGGGDG